MFSNLKEFLIGWQKNTTYFEMLQLVSSLSKLFSENLTPYLDYRLAENLFCKYFNAQNDARSCTAYDARLSNLGIGIKTFGINKGGSTEKIAEFNRLKPDLDKLSGIDLARKIGLFRNQRMQFANNIYDVYESQYHIVGRKEGALVIFNTPYDEIDIDSICDVVDKDTSIAFNDGINEYSFNKSKSVLLKRFEFPHEYKEVPVQILDEPLELLASLLNVKKHYSDSIIPQLYAKEIKGYDYVILPLYSTRGGVPHVPDRSGLNQWNANGRSRDRNEVYIPVPKSIHKNYPQFFPTKDYPFELILPNGDILSAKICQQGGKALMSNPNAALGKWMLRKVLKKKPNELLTIQDLDRFGINSVKIISTHKINDAGERIYKIVFANTGYEDYRSFNEE